MNGVICCKLDLISLSQLMVVQGLTYTCEAIKLSSNEVDRQPTVQMPDSPADLIFHIELCQLGKKIVLYICYQNN